MYELNPIGIFHEKEGVTFILEQQDAVNKKIHYQSGCSWSDSRLFS